MKTEFKGTKGQWGLIGNEIHCNNLLVGYATNSFFKNSTNDIEAKANALLISKAPELLESLISAIILLKQTTEFEVLDSYKEKVLEFEKLLEETLT